MIKTRRMVRLEAPPLGVMLAASLGGAVSMPSTPVYPSRRAAWGEQPNRNRVHDHSWPPHPARGTHLLIIQRPGISSCRSSSQLALPWPWVSRLTSTPSDCHKIIFRLSTRVTVMLTAMVTRDLALPTPSGGGPVAVVGFQLPQLLPAARCA
jgi:hypothetical protein